MQLFFDLRLGYIVDRPGLEGPIGKSSLKSGDYESVSLQFGRSEYASNSNTLYAAGMWTPERLPGGSVIKLGIKEDGKYSDGTILAINASWSIDVPTLTYSGDLDLNTTEINDALGRVDSNSANDVSSIECQLEVTFQSWGIGGWRSSVLDVPVVIYHDIIGGTEGTPTNASDPTQYILKSEAASNDSGEGASLIGIEDLSGNFVSTTVEGALSELASAGGSGGTVTSVSVSGTDGIEVDSGSPITNSGTIALGVNAAALRSHINVDNGANNYTHPNHSGDVTSTGDGVTVIVNEAVTNAKLANVATSTIKGRSTAGTGDPEDLSSSQVRTIINVSDGADVTSSTNVGSSIHGATAKTSPVDADTMPMIDSAASNVLKKVSWLNLKATLKTYFDTIYTSVSTGAVVILCDEKAYNVSGGTFTSGAYRQRDLNTIISGGAYVTLSSNRFTPVAGSWLCQWSCPAYAVNRHCSRLYNNTAGAIAGVGSSEYSATASLVSNRSTGSCAITANGTDAFQFDHQCDATRTTNGLGVSTNNVGQASRYTFVTLTKI